MRRRFLALGAAVAALVAAVAGAALVARLGPGAPGGAAGPAGRPPEPDLAAPAPGPSLAVGITEFNPNLVSATAALPQPWARWRDALGALHPAVFRLVIDWANLQPDRGKPPNLSLRNGGCTRTVPPCLAWEGLRDQLRALATRQRQGGWQGLAVITGTPTWAGVRAAPCARDAPGSARAPRIDALADYRRLIDDVIQLSSREGADLRYWSAWNEPNHPSFLAPPCAIPAAAVYGELVRALRGALAGAPRGPQLVLGETSGLLVRRARRTPVQDFIAELPADVACESHVWDQHAYIGGADPVPAVESALARRRCPHAWVLWVTETGVGAAPPSLSGAAELHDERQGCTLLHARLVRWWHDPHVRLAVQYTFREDPEFRTGLISADMSRARPALAEWMAWGGRRSPGAPAPASACPKA